MYMISNDAACINPQAIYAFFDKLIVWVMRPLTAEELKSLKALCRGGVIPDKRVSLERRRKNKRQPYYPDARFRQRLQLFQPTTQAIAWLARRGDVRLTYVEPSLDWVFCDVDQKWAAYRFFCRTHRKKHRRIQQIVYCGKTRYSERLGAATNSVAYADEVCRLTDELHCFHQDWRTKGSAVLRRAGINSLADLLNFDHRAFWRKRLLLAKFDITRLGRLYNNWLTGSSRRSPWIIRQDGGVGYDVDRRMGGTIIWSMRSTQTVIDTYRSRFDVNSCLIPVGVDHLLPTSSPYD